MKNYQIQEISPDHRQEIIQILHKNWGSVRVVSRGRIHEADQLPGFIAVYHKNIVGLVTYYMEKDQCEIVTLNSLEEEKGIGSQLIEAIKSKAKAMGCRRVWLITTNDNIQAIQFYQKRGFRMVALYPNEIQRSRVLKPAIPMTGFHGITIRDEIEFELILRDAR